MKYELSEQKSVKFPYDGGVDLPTLSLPNMSFQSSAGICEIAIWQGLHLPRTGLLIVELSE